MQRSASKLQPPPPIAAMSWIIQNQLLCDIAIIHAADSTISVGKLRESLKECEACRWVLFVYGPKREERVVERAAIQMPEANDEPPEQRLIAIEQVPLVASNFLLGGQTPVPDDPDVQWWTEPPRTTQNMTEYAVAATDFLRDLRSECPLRVINRPGLWITLRAIAALGYVSSLPPPSLQHVICSDTTLLNELLDRFHTALLYDLRHGAHRFSSLMRAHEDAIAIPAARPGSIVAITPEKPAVTLSLRSMFPTYTRFGALPLESIDQVAPLVASRAVLAQAGWLMAPLRLLLPYVFAAKTVQHLRRLTDGWLAAAAAANQGHGANPPKLRELGVQMRQMFRVPILGDVRLKASNALFTSTSVFGVKLKAPRCAREYLVRAERGEPDAKLVYNARWGMLRMLRALGRSRYEIERAFISEQGMSTWYPDPHRRASERKQRASTLARVFSLPANEQHIACQTLARYGACPFRGNVGACCKDATGSAERVFGIWNPMQVARLGAPRVVVQVEEPTPKHLLHDMLIVPKPPERLYHASESRL
jgi:hypothetical protein